MGRRKITGIEAMDQAAFWLKLVGGDYDDAVDFAELYERGYRRQQTVVAAIRLLERQNEEHVET